MPPGASDGPRFTAGDIVVLARPDSPNAYRSGQSGLVTRVSRHVRPGNPKRGTAPVTTWWYDLDFRADVVKGGKNYGNLRGLHREQELEPL
jgi:hypothetical protein